jgi:hypothetical protein
MRSAQRFDAGRRTIGSKSAKRIGRVSIAGAALILLLVMPYSVERLSGGGLAEAAVQRAKSFLELIQQRSPGARSRGQLAQTKHKKTVLHQRALPKVRMVMPIPPTGSPTTLVDIVAPSVPIIPAGFELASIPPLSPPPSPLEIPLIRQPSLIVPPTETPSTPPVIPPPAVPEPDTWATMILGLGLIGWMLRSRRQARRERSLEA